MQFQLSVALVAEDSQECTVSQEGTRLLAPVDKVNSSVLLIKHISLLFRSHVSNAMGQHPFLKGP